MHISSAAAAAESAAQNTRITSCVVVLFVSSKGACRVILSQKTC